MRNSAAPLRFVFSCLAVFLLAGTFPERGRCGEGKKLNIVATLFPQYDFARIIGGEKVAVRMLLPSGSDPHAFDPRPSDLMAIAGADVFVHTGVAMEPWAEKAFEAVKDSGTARAVDVSAGMRLLRSGEHGDGGEDGPEERGGEGGGEHSHGNIPDPHVWLDPVLALVMVDNLLAAISEADPDNAAWYAANASTLKNDLRALDAECRAMAAGAKRRVLVFGGRFAFAYFIERYGLEHVGAYDFCGAGAEPSVRRVLEITEHVEKNRIPVIYHEEYAEPRISAGIAGATGCKTMTAHSLHSLSAAELASGVTFMEVMRLNVAAFAEGLR